MNLETLKGWLRSILAPHYCIRGKHRWALLAAVPSYCCRDCLTCISVEEYRSIENVPEDVRPESYKFRDMLERWAAWWNGPGREGFRGSVTPPLTETGELLRCIGCCNGNDLPEGEWCRACGHKE